MVPIWPFLIFKLNKINNYVNYFDYNLNSLNEITDGDIKENKSIIESFIKEFPKLLDELEKSLRNKDIQAIAKNSHKMKSPVALFGMDELLEDIIYLENYSKKVNEDLSKFHSDLLISKETSSQLLIKLMN